MKSSEIFYTYFALLSKMEHIVHVFKLQIVLYMRIKRTEQLTLKVLPLTLAFENINVERQFRQNEFRSALLPWQSLSALQKWMYTEWIRRNLSFFFLACFKPVSSSALHLFLLPLSNIFKQQEYNWKHLRKFTHLRHFLAIKIRASWISSYR